MDYPEVTCVEWFYGYGGNALGLKRAIPGLREIAKCERDAFVVANMVSKMEAGLMDAVPVWTDCKTFPIAEFHGLVDLFIASYPCQGFSHAGKRLGVEDERHLWPYCRKWIQGARPGAVWLENVEGHVSLGLSTVLADLEEDDYTAAWGIFSASEVGAPHQRKRVFILAYDRRNGHAWRALQNGIKGRGVQESTQSQRSEQPLVRGEVARCGECSGSEELALRNSIGRTHGQSKEQSAEARFVPQRDPATSGPLVAQQQQQGLEGHAGDVNHARWEPRGEDRPVAEGGLCGVNQVDSRLFGQEKPEQQATRIEQSNQVWPSRPGVSQYGWEPPRVVGNAEKRNVRGEQRRGVGAGEETDVEWKADNNITDGPSKDSVIERLREAGYTVEPCEQCQKDGDDRYTVCFSDNGSGDCCSVEGMRRILGEPAQQLHDGSGSAGPTGPTGREELADAGGETQSPLGRDANGLAAGLDLSRYTGLSDSELAEIREWMEKGTNRTDELRMCGNGVVPATAERAFRVLYKELQGAR